MNSEKCNFIKEDGERCDAYALTDSDLCFSHEPKLEEKRNLARSMGGRIARTIIGIPIELCSIEDVIGLLAEVIGNLRAMPISINQAKAIISSCETALHCLELGELSKRLTAMEERIGIIDE